LADYPELNIVFKLLIQQLKQQLLDAEKLLRTWEQTNVIQVRMQPSVQKGVGKEVTERYGGPALGKPDITQTIGIQKEIAERERAENAITAAKRLELERVNQQAIDEVRQRESSEQTSRDRKRLEEQKALAMANEEEIRTKQKQDIAKLAEFEKAQRKFVPTGADKEAIRKEQAQFVQLSKAKIAAYKKEGNIKDAILEKTRLKELENFNQFQKQYVSGAQRAHVQSLKEEEKTHRQLAQSRMGAIKQQQNLDHALDVAIGKLIRYRVAFAAMYKIYQGFTESIKTFIDVNYQLAQIAKVISPVGGELEKIKEIAFELADTYKVAISGVFDAYKIWAQMGLRENDILEATRATLIASNAMEMDAKEVTEDLTAAIFSYGVETENLIGIIDKWMAVQKDYPVTAQDLANGMKAVGIAAKNLGIDIDSLNGMITAIQSVTRKSGTEIGNSLKTIFARMPREKMIVALQDIGVFAMKSKTEFRNFNSVFDELAMRWGTLTDVQKRNIAQMGAGVHRYVDFIALMDNYQQKLAASATSQGSFGQALEANAIEIATVKKEIEGAKIAFAKFGEGFGADLGPTLRNLVGAATAFFNAMSGKNATKIVSFITRLATSFVVLKGAELGVIFIGRKLISGFAAHIMTVKELTADNIALGYSEEFAAAKAIKMHRALMLMRTANIVIAVLSTLLTIYEMIRLSADKASESVEGLGDTMSVSAEDIRSARDKYQAQVKQSQVTESLISQRQSLLKQLSGLTKGTDEYRGVEANLLRIQNQLSNSSIEVANQFQLIAGAGKIAYTTTESLASSMKRLIEQQKTMAETAKREYKNMAKIALFGLGKPEDVIRENKETEEQLAEYVTKLYDLATKASENIKNIDLAGIYKEWVEKFEPQNVKLSDFMGQKLKESLNVKGISDIMADINLDPDMASRWKGSILEPYSKLLTDINSTIKRNVEGTNEDIFDRLADRLQKLFGAAIGETSVVIPPGLFGETLKTLTEVLTRSVQNFGTDIDKKTKEIMDQTDIAENLQKSWETITEPDDKYAITAPKYMSDSVLKLANEWRELTETATSGIDKIIGKELEWANALGIEAKENDTRLKVYEETHKNIGKFLDELKSKEGALTFELGRATEKQKEFVGDQESYDTAGEKISELKTEIAEMGTLIKEVAMEVPKLQNAMLAGGLATIKVQKEVNKILKEASHVYQFNNTLMGAKSSLIKDIYNNERKALEYELATLNELYNKYTLVYTMLANMGEGQSEFSQEAKKYMEELIDKIQQSMDKLKLLDFETQNKGLKEFSKNMREAFGAGLGDIQSKWIAASQTRVKLQEDLVLAHKDLSDAQTEYNKAVAEGSEANTESILEARSELRRLEDELGKVNNAFRMLGNTIADTFSQLADITFRNIMEEIASDLTSEIIDKFAKKVPYIPLPEIDAEGNLISGGKKAGDEIKQKMVAAGALVAAQIVGSMIAGGGIGATKGAAIGGTFGTAYGGTLGSLGWAGGPLLGIAGGILGGLFGGLFDKQEDAIKENTNVTNINNDAVEANTKALEELKDLIINAPTKYRLPPIGGGEISGGNVIINGLNVGGANSTRDFTNLLEKYGVDLRTTGTRKRIMI
jgi:TP901 family phage tail tape measure protein